MDALIIENNEIKGIETNTGKTFLGPVILATGHSARDVYRWLAANNVTIEAKGIAVGVRLEHPATLIDQIQYLSLIHIYSRAKYYLQGPCLLPCVSGLTGGSSTCLLYTSCLVISTNDKVTLF